MEGVRGKRNWSDPDLVDMGVGAPVFKKFKKMPLKSFGNFLNNFLHVHISF
jgi:hypothetical protein